MIDEALAMDSGGVAGGAWVFLRRVEDQNMEQRPEEDLEEEDIERGRGGEGVWEVGRERTHLAIKVLVPNQGG